MNIRKAVIEDLPEIIKMISNDELGSQREDYQEPLPEKYYTAFRKINEDDNQELIVIDKEGDGIIGTLQISYIQYLTYQGGIRAQIEGVRIRKDQRGTGIGKQLINGAIERAKERGAHLIQLTTDKKRPGAIKFYESHGFVASHEGMKLHLINFNDTQIRDRKL